MAKILPIGSALRRALWLCAALSTGCSRPARPNVILIVMDTTRADHLSHAGWENDTTPNLSALLADSVLYSEAHTVAPWTLPAHMSMFTGELPGRHHANWSAFDSDDATTLAQILGVPFTTPLSDRLLTSRLKERGYTTIGISCNPWISSRCGFDAGFDALYPVWHSAFHPDAGLAPSPLEIPLGKRPVRPAGRALLALNHHLRARGLGDDPFFLFFNFIDPHYPYISSPHKGVEFGGDLTFYRSMTDPRRPKEEIDIISGREKADFGQMMPFYDSCIYLVDHSIGKLVAWLKEHELYDGSMIIVTSDHGEHMGENGRVSHQLSVEEELLHIPLIVKYPGNIRAGSVESNPHVSVADVYATVLAAASDGSDPADFSNDLARMEKWDRPYNVAEYYFSDSYLSLFRESNAEFDVEPHRVVKRVIYAAGRKFVFENLELAHAHRLDPNAPEKLEPALERSMSSWLERYVAGLVEGTAPAPVEAESEEFLEALKALGYVR